MSTAHWDRRSEADKSAMKSALMPLVAASRTRDFVDVTSARVQIAAFMQALSDCPKPVVEEAVGAMVSRGVVWMPKPGELKSECARIVAEKRKAAARRHLESCDHSGHFIENDEGRMERCTCWKRAQIAMNEVGQPIAVPMLPEETHVD